MPARGEVWFANLDPTRGTEQAGTRPSAGSGNSAWRRCLRSRAEFCLRPACCNDPLPVAPRRENQ
jgi:hypothetical protein